MTDIRDQAHLSGSQLKALNFIKDSRDYVFRKHYRSGLRSHIFELLLADDVQKETTGEIRDGIRIFPRARPQKMFRIFRNRFATKETIFKEIKKYKLLLKYLGQEYIAASEEVIMDYRENNRGRIVFCGLQEYIEGEKLDPWRIYGNDFLKDFFTASASGGIRAEDLVKTAKKNLAGFVTGIHSFISNTGYLPDLAGIGNLILTPEGEIKLVDINNIVPLQMDGTIHLDDKGYPSCDVSVEVLSILEKVLLERDIPGNTPLYLHFLTRDRQKKVKALERDFHRSLQGKDP